MTNLLIHLKKHLFIYLYSSIIILFNLIGIVWAKNPYYIGAYIVYFIYFPLDICLIFLGISYLIYHKYKKTILPYFVYLLLILLIPICCFTCFYYIIINFYNYGTC